MKPFLFIILFISHTAFASENHVCDTSCTFVLKNEKSGNFTITNSARAKQRLTPFSTFKIANTLIAVDLGLVESLSQTLSFDHEKYPVQNWWPHIWYEKPLTVRGAFQNSAVPIYQQIAAQVGPTNMAQYLTKFDYGNQDISSGIDTFWLNGSLKISAVEQVDFLQRLFKERGLISNKTLSFFKEVMVVEKTEKYTLYAKTGGGQINSKYALGWYVGVVESKGDINYFAVNVDAKSFREVKEKRILIAKQELKKLGVL